MLSNSIKEATKEAHLFLEKKVVKQLKEIRTNKDYADFLKHFYAYFNHLEKAIAPFITVDVLPDYAQRRNSSYLKNDIEELGSDISELPATTVPQITSTLQALGALYVMEGSIMGGPIIVKMLEKANITTGVSFYSGYGENTGQMWGVFTGVMNAQAKTEEEESVAIEAAKETFLKFSDVFAEVTA
ncbi:heme oxygenase [Filimonas lacunae]|uniref:Heme oxygenase n=1 Tax=Filimonas lacunae TaxID=477680 RepID=A0A173MEF7_9BACT|nr:biliverdin-producing heme oxygenase [Filimonas lacunae]BAV05955.1 bacteriophytochrome heme oxygenase BphO [Filimonas lacunae]SIT23909.1 heme oxygenase [Filimonas lacunae]